MKKQLLPIFILIFAFGFTLAGAEVPEEAASSIQLAESGIDFGTVYEGEIAQNELQIKNTGNADLCITKVESDSVCTVDKPVPLVIGPGEQDSLEVTLNTTNKLIGDYLEEITLYTNDPIQPLVKLALKAKIIKPSFQPENSPAENEPAVTPPPASYVTLPESNFNFGKVKEGEIVQHDFVIRNTGPADLCIYKVDVACVCTTAQPIPQLIKPGGQGILKVSLNTARKFDGEYVEEITIYSNDPVQPFVKLMIKADITNSTLSAAEKKLKEAPVLKTITPKDARELLKANPGAVLVDVRALEEYNEGHIPSSILIPLERLSTDAPSVLKDPDAIIIVYCRSGKRSQRAARKLTDMGYQNVNDLGGILNWPYEVVK